MLPSRPVNAQNSSKITDSLQEYTPKIPIESFEQPQIAASNKKINAGKKPILTRSRTAPSRMERNKYQANSTSESGRHHKYLVAERPELHQKDSSSSTISTQSRSSINSQSSRITEDGEVQFESPNAKNIASSYFEPITSKKLGEYIKNPKSHKLKWYQLSIKNGENSVKKLYIFPEKIGDNTIYHAEAAKRSIEDLKIPINSAREINELDPNGGYIVINRSSDRPTKLSFNSGSGGFKTTPKDLKNMLTDNKELFDEFGTMKGFNLTLHPGSEGGKTITPGDKDDFATNTAP